MRKNKGLIIVISLLGLLSVILAGSKKNAADWPRSTPAEQGLNGKKLKYLVHLIKQGERFPNVHCLLIVKGGYLVVEKYFGEYHAGKSHMLQSVSKSVTSALIGIAIKNGVIKNTDERVLGFFPNMKKIQNLDKRKRAMKLRDILTMRTGTDYHERGPGSPHFQLNALSTGWDEFYLNRPMNHDPGVHFQYDSGGVILLSAILKNRTGKHADEYAAETLFKDLDITKNVAWYKNQEGHPHTGGGLSIQPRDMAKFGQMYLSGGKWKGRQVVPSQWVSDSFKLHVKFPKKPHSHNIGYGYLWWILEPDPQGSLKNNIYAAKGFMGQYIFIVPEHDMVVVITGGSESYTDMIKPEKFLYTHILPAIIRK